VQQGKSQKEKGKRKKPYFTIVPLLFAPEFVILATLH
jgi:hypothetical protein